MISASELIDEVRRLGGNIVLLLYVDRDPQLELEVCADAEWLIEAIRRHKPEVVSELQRRYQSFDVLTRRVQ